MAVFLDLSKSKPRPKKTPRPDAVLMCSGCKMFTMHSHERNVAHDRSLKIMYECVRCGEHRQYGIESLGLSNQEDGNDVDDRAA